MFSLWHFAASVDSRVRGGLRLVLRRGQHLQRDRQGTGQPQRVGRTRGPTLLRRKGERSSIST